MLLFLLACDYSGSTKVLDSTVAESTPGTVGDSGGTSPSDSDATTPPDPADSDDDQDGYTENQGDCDDADARINPGEADGCDGADNDCDGTTDEDAAADDYEPNDTTPYDLGSLEDDPDRSLVGILSMASDVDRYQFSIVDDTFDFFTITMTLSNIPAGAQYVLALSRLRSDGDEDTGLIDSVSGADSVSLSFSDTTLVEDGGDYELAVYALSGADCSSSYLVGIEQ